MESIGVVGPIRERHIDNVTLGGSKKRKKWKKKEGERERWGSRKTKTGNVNYWDRNTEMWCDVVCSV